MRIFNQSYFNIVLLFSEAFVADDNVAEHMGKNQRHRVTRRAGDHARDGSVWRHGQVRSLLRPASLTR